MSLPTNPYIAGAPLRGEKGFFGRQDTMEWVQRELRNSETNALVIFGQRRIGKTTLLLQLARNLSQDKFLPVYFDLQDQATRPLGQTLADIADTLCEKANLDLGQLGPFDNQGRYFQKEFLPKFYASLGEERRPVFLLDEFDVLDQTAEAELADTATAKALFPLLRRLMTTDARPAFIFVVGRRAEDLSIDFNATFKASVVREIWVLDDKSAETLVRQAQTNGTLKFTDEGVQRVLSLTNHHPYLTQLLCQRIWELAYASNPSSPLIIDSPQVDTALESSLEAGNQALDWLWSGLNPAERIYASALAEISDENKIIPEDQIIQVLAAHAARLRTREVELAPRDLVKRHVLEVSGERSYRFAVELFRRWVQKNKPLMAVKDEVDRVNPMADRLFVVGDGFYDAHEWERAAFYFRETLNVNPRHFRSRLYLGETLLEQGKVDEAITELDQALVLDREEARLPLARAWLAKAEILKPDGESDVLLHAYEKVLELSPRESQAIQGRVAAWIQRAQQAEARDDLPAARDAYLQAGDQNNVDRLNTLERERLLNRLLAEAQGHVRAQHWESAISVYTEMVELALDDNSRLAWQAELEKAQAQVSEQHAKAKAQTIEKMKTQAQTHEQRGEWEKAIQVYENLLQMDGEDVWETSLENAKNEQEMLVIFEQGRKTLMQEEWKEAQRLFAQLIQSRPDYSRDGLFAVDLLQDSIKRRKRFSHDRHNPIQTVRRTVTLPRVLVRVLVGLVLLCISVFGISYAYNYFSKPLSIGTIYASISVPEETIATGNANRLERLYYSYHYATDIDISSDSSLFAVSVSEYSGFYKNYGAIVQVGSGSTVQVLYGHSAEITTLDFSPDGFLLATGSQDQTVKIWNVKSGQLMHTLEGHTDNVNSVVFSPDGSLLASGSGDNTVRIWQVSDGTLLRILEGHTGTVNSVVFSPDGSLLASGSGDNTVRIWQVSDGTRLHIFEGHTNSVKSVVFSPDGNLLASGGRDSTTRIWQVGDGAQLATLIMDFPYIDHLKFSPDGKLLAAVSLGSIYFWGINPVPTETSTPLPTVVSTSTVLPPVDLPTDTPVSLLTAVP